MSRELRLCPGVGAKNVALSCPHWTGIPTQLALGVGVKFALET